MCVLVSVCLSVGGGSRLCLCSESLTNGWIKGMERKRESLGRRINGRIAGASEDSKGERGCACWTLVATGGFTSGCSDFEGC